GARPPVDDAQVTARVQSAFFLDDRIKMRRIDVKAHTGVVTLSGEVASEDERAQALRLARTTEGVQRIEDHLAVVTPSPGAAEGGAGATAPRPRVNDATLTTTIQARYFVDPMVKRSAIEVSAKDGVVQLQGTVPSEAARTQALSIARNIDGVVQVVDRLTVAPAKP
ncbi:MAG: BON domain-containing protein, partial [Vicinamibacterales bacterium]